MATLYEKVSTLCKDNGITIYRMCKDTGVLNQTVNNWKRRPKAVPDIKSAVAIADYFNINVKDLM